MTKTSFKIVFLFFTCLTLFKGYSQDFSALWQAHYSYNDIVDVVSGENKIYAAAQNAIFEYDTLSEELNTITTVEGLSGEQITTIHYSDIFQSLLIGYETGLIEIYFETDASVLTIVDILDKENITPANKRINEFYEHNGLVYISTDFGVSVYDLDRLEFGDTYFLGNGGAQINVNQVSVLNDEIYVACGDNNGLKKANLSNPNLIDFSQWQTVLGGNFRTVNTLSNKIYTVTFNRELIQIDGASITNLFSFSQNPKDAKVVENNYIVATENTVYVYDENLILINGYQATSEFDAKFTSATQLGAFVYLGSTEFGVLKSAIADNTTFIEIKPNGPLFNEVFRLNAEYGTVYATFGDYTQSFNPYPIRSRGFSYFIDEAWISVPFESVLGARNLSEISVNPFNPNQVFMSSCVDGILEVNNFESTILYDQDNSGLESLFDPSDPNYINVRVTASVFDTNGVLWSLTSKAPNPLKSYDTNTSNWQGYDFSAIIDDPLTDEFGFFDIVIDDNGTKWMGGYSNGLYTYTVDIHYLFLIIKRI